MNHLRLVRNYFDDNVTLGKLYFLNECIASTLEDPWKANKSFISCIPSGYYRVIIGYSPHFKRDLYHVQDVPERKYILFHPGNTIKDTLGCILLGKRDKPEQVFVTESRITTEHFMSLMDGKPFSLEIVNGESG